jgi:hypothetical protein
MAILQHFSVWYTKFKKSCKNPDSGDFNRYVKKIPNTAYRCYLLLVEKLFVEDQETEEWKQEENQLRCSGRHKLAPSVIQPEQGVEVMLLSLFANGGPGYSY